MTLQLHPAVVRLHDEHGRVTGAGFLAGKREILTCAHVVTRTLGLPDGVRPPADAQVRLDFPLIAPKQIVTATVAVWHPPAADSNGDVAGLKLTGAPPAGARAARLLMADELWGHEFRTFGFPMGHDDGVWGSGRLLAHQATGWIQMEDVKQTGYRVELGFSGAPVWDDQLDGVVGITVAAERRPEARTAYLIPAGVLVAAWPALTPWTIPPCPYRGLSAFREQDAALFFGREELTDQLVDAVTGNLLLTVVGASGSGKSSLVFAGLLPRLRQHPEWAVAAMRPATGSTPLAALAAALLPLLEPGMSEAARLAEVPVLANVLGEERLAEVVDRVLNEADVPRLLLVVDQFEELFAMNSAKRRRFVDVLLEAVTAQRQRVQSAIVIALTLRADFLGQALAHPGLAQAMQGATMMLGPMSREQLRRAIEGPAAPEVIYEAGLVERILDDVGDNPGNLPLLEFALTLLWEGQANGRVTHASYAELGGVNGALARYAEQVYLRLSQADRDDARRLFVQLVRPGEGTEHTRRVARQADLGEQRWRLAQRLAGSRLVVTDRDVAGIETVELVHEALLPGWQRLREWIEADRAFRAWQERVRNAIQQWEASGRDDGALLRGAPLAEAERWLAERLGEISLNEQRFVAASRAHYDRELQTVRRRNRQLRTLAVGLSVLLVMALVLAGFAQRQTRRADMARKEAQAQSRIATSRQLAAQATYNADSQPALALLQSLQALEVADSVEAWGSLLGGLQADSRISAFLPADNPVRDVAFSPDGRMLASGGEGDIVTLWDVQHRQQLARLAGHTDRIWSVAFSPDGQILASGGDDNTVILWDVQRRQQLAKLTGHTDAVLSVAFSPDRRTLAVGSFDNTVILWDVEHRQRLGKPLTGHTNTVTDVAFSPDGRTLASGSSDNTIILWDVRRRRRLGKSLTGHTDAVWSIAFSPDGRTLASGSADTTAILWDAQHHQKLGELAGHTDAVLGVAFSPDGRTLASGGADKTILLWDVRRRQKLGELAGHTDAMTAVAFSPDGRTLASGSADNTVILWDVQRRRELGKLAGHSAALAAVQFSPDGRTLASGSDDNTVMLWDVKRHRLLGKPLIGHANSVWSVAFSPDGRTLASGSADTTAILWDVQRRQLLRRLTRHTDGIWGVAFSPDGQTLASASADKTVILWDVQRRQPLGRPIRGHAERVLSVAFAPDGQTLATGSDDNTITLWDVRRTSWRTQACDIVGPLTRSNSRALLPGPEYQNLCR